MERGRGEWDRLGRDRDRVRERERERGKVFGERERGARVEEVEDIL